MEYKYFQFASPFSSNRTIVTADKVDNYWDESRDTDTGRSWQFFDDSLLHYVKYNGGSPSGYQGKSDSPIIPVDIDNSSTAKLIDVLSKLGDILGDLEDVCLYYSGKKGYHIEVPSSLFALNPSKNLPERMKRMVSKFDIGADLSLYKQNQLYRMNNSLNVGGGYYKTQIDIEDIIAGINLEEIQCLAKKPHLPSFEMIEPPYAKERNWLIDIWEQTECPDSSALKVSGGVNEGHRNENAYDTALGLKTQQIPKEIAYEIIEAQNEKNNPPEPNLKELMRTVDSVYDGKYFKKFPINPVLLQLKEDDYWNELNYRRKVVCIYMLMDANVREHIYKGVRVRRNQFVFGKISTAKRWGMKIETLRKDMEKFEKDGIISRNVVSKDGKNLFSIITLETFDVTHHLYTQFY